MSPFEPWMLAAIDCAGYNGIEDEHIERVAQEILKTGLSEIDRSTFEAACRRAFVDPANFTDEDIERLNKKLNG